MSKYCIAKNLTFNSVSCFNFMPQITPNTIVNLEWIIEGEIEIDYVFSKEYYNNEFKDLLKLKNPLNSSIVSTKTTINGSLIDYEKNYDDSYNSEYCYPDITTTEEYTKNVKAVYKSSEILQHSFFNDFNPNLKDKLFNITSMQINSCLKNWENKNITSVKYRDVTLKIPFEFLEILQKECVVEYLQRDSHYNFNINYILYTIPAFISIDTLDYANIESIVVKHDNETYNLQAIKGKLYEFGKDIPLTENKLVGELLAHTIKVYLVGKNKSCIKAKLFLFDYNKIELRIGSSMITTGIKQKQ